MLKPKDIEVVDIDGKKRTYTITRFPATDGMEIMYRLPTSGIPKIGDFAALKEVRDDVFKFVYVNAGNEKIPLTTKALIDNHVPDAETAYKVMGAILSYNFQSLGKLMSAGFYDTISARVLDTARKLLRDFSQQSSAKSKQH